MVLPERKLESIEQFLQRYPEVKEVMIDGTERPIARPQDKERQKEHYSGKSDDTLVNILQQSMKANEYWC